MAAPPPDDPGRIDPSTRPTGWARIESLFHDALELAPAEREPFLARLAAEDPAAAGEVRSLLDSHDASSGFLGAPPLAEFTLSVAPGERFGPYRIVEEIGRGGMGVVYRATRDDQSLTKDVAIKLIDPGMRSDEILR